MNSINLTQIKEILKSIDIIPAIEQGFVAYSNGRAIIPPVGEMRFTNPPGDVHIKYGYLINDEYYVIKIASGFYQNAQFNLPTSNGLMMLFSQKTGELLTILLDEGYLTDLRTAAAGAIAAKYLAPSNISSIGIIGTGIQARLQLYYLKNIISCKSVIVFGRDKEKLMTFQREMQRYGFTIQTTQILSDLTSQCNLIVTTTPSCKPLLFAEHIKNGTHITAVGADTPDKQELDSHLFSKADVIVVDSISQCMERGDSAHALRNKVIHVNQLIELGSVISGGSLGRTHEDQITIADLTGLAVQDLQIAKAVAQHSNKN
jgi:ornithine cyclodeaminase